MGSAELKINSRVVVSRSVVPNATGFIGWKGTVKWFDGKQAMVSLDNDPAFSEPVMFFLRELDLL